MSVPSQHRHPTSCSVGQDHTPSHCYTVLLPAHPTAMSLKPSSALKQPSPAHTIRLGQPHPAMHNMPAAAKLHSPSLAHPATARRHLPAGQSCTAQPSHTPPHSTKPHFACYCTSCTAHWGVQKPSNCCVSVKHGSPHSTDTHPHPPAPLHLPAQSCTAQPSPASGRLSVGCSDCRPDWPQCVVGRYIGLNFIV